MSTQSLELPIAATEPPPLCSRGLTGSSAIG